MIGVLELLNKRKVKENKKIIKNIWEKWLLFQSLNYWCHATLKAYYIQRLEILEGNSSCVHVCVYIYFAFRASKHEWWEIWRWVLWLWSMWDRDSFFFLHFLMPCDLLSLTLSLLSFFKSYTNFFYVTFTKQREIWIDSFTPFYNYYPLRLSGYNHLYYYRGGQQELKDLNLWPLN